MITIAYIDPSSATLGIQIIIGVILGGLLTIRLWWVRVKNRFASLLGRRSEDG
jgi:hypothetical protein